MARRPRVPDPGPIDLMSGPTETIAASIPRALALAVRAQTGKREFSRFVAQAMHRALLRRNLESLVKDLIAEFGERYGHPTPPESGSPFAANRNFRDLAAGLFAHRWTRFGHFLRYGGRSAARIFPCRDYGRGSDHRGRGSVERGLRARIAADGALGGDDAIRFDALRRAIDRRRVR